jgi:tetratricopeptide (TPR) repeat protein
MARLLVLLTALALAAAPLSLADEGMEENAAQTAEALSLQALALLAAGRGHEQALQKLDQALASTDKGNLDLRALRAAHAALHDEDVAQARRLLEQAFSGEKSHVVGVTYRSKVGTAELVAGIVAAVALLAGTAGLLRRRRLERAATPV